MISRGAALSLFGFLATTLLLLAPAEFHQAVGEGIGDGLIEYRVAERLVTTGRLDLPGFQGWDDPRVREGPDGRTYSIFGLGQSFLFAAGIFVDGLWTRVAGPPSGEHAYDPLFFSTTINCLVHAATGALLYVLLGEVGLGAGVALVTSLLFTFGSMGLRYAMLSFDVPLANLMILVSVHAAIRTETGSRSGWAWAGISLGLALLTRAVSAVFLLPLGLYAARRVQAGTADFRRVAVGLGAGFLMFLGILGVLNAVRFGSPFETGYTSTAAAFGFDMAIWKTVPALLVSPGRGILLYTPYALLALFGLRRLVRARPDAALLILGIALANFVLFALNRNWATANSWGPRYQLLTVLMLSVPFGFWLHALDLRNRRAAAVGAVAATVLFQLACLLAPFGSAGRSYAGYWTIERAQIFRTLEQFLRTVGEGDWGAIGSWWLGPHANDPGTGALASILLLLWTAAIVGMWHTMRRRSAT